MMKNKTMIMLMTVLMLGAIALAACGPKEISLVDTSWVVTEIDGEPVIEDSEVTMQFSADQIAGKASCNNYFAQYTLEGDQLTLGPAGSTMMWCEGLMDQETLFLSSLEKVESVSLKNGQLTLNLNDGGSIVMEQLESIN